MKSCLALPLLIMALSSPSTAHVFDTVIYIPVEAVIKMRNHRWLQDSWIQIASRIHVDKVYIETYRSRVIADDALIEDVKKFFAAQGVKVAGGICYSDRDNGQFVSFVYTRPEDRAYVKHVSEFTAKHFDEVILDDFFFANTKTQSDIAAKGTQDWSGFRLKTMDDVARDLVVGPAKAVNPHIRMVIKFPNWYEHFQGNGYDLATEPQIFDAIYAGTETRDPVDTDQNLQQYEGYNIVRYFENIAPGRMGGGWVDTYDIRYIDRYAEQLWLTVFAKAREITLFNYLDLLKEATPGERPWSGQTTSVRWERIQGRAKGSSTFATVAGDSLDQIKPFIGELGNPIGIASFRPAHAVGEDFLHNFFGMIGIPINLYPAYPRDQNVILLTEGAKFDPDIVADMKQSLEAGKTVIMTTGLLHALAGRGVDDLIELRYSPLVEPVTRFIGAFGPGTGTDLGTSGKAILFPQVRFITNDAWPVIRGIADKNAFPVLLMSEYGRGRLFVLTVPDNFADLYELPEPTLNALRSYVMGQFPVRIEAPSRVSVFAYDNGSLIVESFRDEPTQVAVLATGGYTRLLNLQSGQTLNAVGSASATAPQRLARFEMTLPPHSYLAYQLK